MDCNGSLRVPIFLSASLWDQMSPYRSLCVLMDFNWSLLVFIGPYASLWILMGPYVSL